jgi:maltooligosyltrehalose trehalohydrolase
MTTFPWERPLGARPIEAGLTEFRVWAPSAKQVAVRVGGAEVPLEGEGRTDAPLEEEGFSVYGATVPAASGSDYWFVVDGVALPDPASRWQPEGLRGPSRVFAPTRPRPLAQAPQADSARLLTPTERLERLVIYELHIGTFSEEGTFASTIPYLDELAELGVTAIEIMPVAEFPGARGWGYDGVYISAAQSSYGGPAGLLALVDAAHQRGIAVILDVVYNHVGVSGVDALKAFGPYFTEKYGTPWGKAMNFDDELSDPVREWVLQSAEGWIRDFGIDGLRLDAIHAIHDSSPEHIVAAVTRRVHATDPGATVILESGLNDPKVVEPTDRGGWASDAVWADDFHHALRTLVSDERDGYYAEFGKVAQLAKAFHRPHVHDGDYSTIRKRRFGAPADQVPPERFIVFSQDHDQVGNRAFGDRMPHAARPLAAFITLLSPFTPMLFMGEEYGENAPFQFFSDHIDPKIAEATRTGRRKEFAAFASFGEEVPDPQSLDTFMRSKLSREVDAEIASLYRHLLAARSALPAGEPDAITFDEEARWLRVRRGSDELLANFSDEPVGLEVPAGTELVLSTHAISGPFDGRVELEALSGALVRHFV